MNALKSGIDAKSQLIRGEKVANLEALKTEYYLHFRPIHPQQRMLVDILIDSEWLLRRFRTVEAQLWEYTARITYKQELDVPLGKAVSGCDDSLARLQRRIDIAQKNYRTALQDLKRLQAEALTSQPDPEPAPPPDPPTQKNQPVTRKNGFVPQTPSQNPPLPQNPIDTLPPHPVEI